MRAIVVAATLLAMSGTVALSAEPPDANRFGPGPHMLDAQPFRTAIRHHHKTARRHTATRYARHSGSRNTASLDPLSPAPLNAKIQEILTDCGSRIASSYRPGSVVAGRGGVSNHALHRAYDISYNPRCIYAHLHGWPGGYSTDYATAPGGPHVHISYNPHKEWGVRFVHRNPFLHYARRHHYALN